MLARLRIRLSDEKNEIRSFKGSAFQGVLFEHIDEEYGEKLHQQSMHPYSQYVHTTDEGTEWVINTLTDEAYEYMIMPLMSPSFKSISLIRGDVESEIISKQIETLDTSQLLSDFKDRQAGYNYRIETLTPVSFKQNGAYNVLPMPGLVYQSLMNRYSLLSDNLSMADHDTLDELVSLTLISGYSLHTVRYPIEKTTIPGFAGSFTFHIKESQTMARYVRMMLKFGEFSGLGVKTGMGMGAIRISERGEKNEGK